MRLQKLARSTRLAAMMAVCLMVCLVATAITPASGAALRDQVPEYAVLANNDPVIYEPTITGHDVWARAHGLESESMTEPATRPLEPGTGSIQGQYLTQVLYPEQEATSMPDGGYYLTVG